MLVLSLFTFHFSLITAFAQEAPDIVPPPLKLISKEEKTQLSVQSDPKSHTKLVIEFLETRLKGSEEALSRADYDAMYRELGDFHGLVDESLDFLVRHDTGDKSLYNLKRLELGLRSFLPRLENIRRELPLKFEPYVRRLVKFVRNARTRALDPMFDDHVVPNQRPEE